jgi:hypothetical protein
MSKMVKNVKSKEIYLKLYYFWEKNYQILYNKSANIFNWRILPVSTSTSMCPCPCLCQWTWTWTGTHGHGHLFSAIAGGKLQQHDLPMSTSMSMSLSMSVSIDTDTDWDMDVDSLSTIDGGELQQHKSQELLGWLCLQYVTICSLYTFLL